MLVLMKSDCTVHQCSTVEEAIARLGYTPVSVPGIGRTAICVTGEHGKTVEAVDAANEPGILSRCLAELDGVVAAFGREAGAVSRWLRLGLSEAGRSGRSGLRW